MARALLPLLACLGWVDVAAGQGTYVGTGVSIARGADGLGLISYYDGGDGDLKVAHCSNTLCTRAVITRLDGMNGDDVGATTSIAIGSDGLGLIAYYDTSYRDLKVAHCTDLACTSATITRVDTTGQAGLFPSLAIGADGRALIAYASESPPPVAVKVAHCADLACSSVLISIVDSLGVAPGGLTIGADGLGLVTYTRTDTLERLRVAHCTDAACTATTRTTVGAGTAGAVTVGADGLGLFAYRMVSGELGAAHCADVLCTSATVNRLDSLYFASVPAVAFGADGRGLLSYATASTNLSVAHCSDLGCTTASTSTLDTGLYTGSSSAAAVGGDGLGLVAYSDGLNGYLKVAHCSDAACTTATNVSILDGLPSDADLVPGHTSVAKGADGLGLISYWDGIARDLRVAHCSNLDCSHATLSRPDSAGDVGEYSSLAVGADGLGLISYYDAGQGDLKAAHCSDVLCTTATVTTLDSAGDVGRYTSVAIGTDGLGLISYYDVTGRHLKVAHCADTACTTATLGTVDSAADTGQHTNLAIGADGLGLISYLRGRQPFLAHCQDVACTTAMLTGYGAFIAGDASLMIGSDGLGVFSYYETFRGDNTSWLRHCSDAACSASTPGAGVGGGTEMASAKGADGLPLLSFHQIYGGDLAVAHCTDVACSNYTYLILDATGEVGRYSSLAIGSDGLGLIAYWDATEGRLKVAHCLDVPCGSARISVLDAATRFYTVAPCRAADTRPARPPLGANTTRTFDVAGTCGVPLDARAVALNAVAVDATEAGDLRLYPADAPEPNASLLNFEGGRTRANSGVVPLGGGGRIKVRCDMVPGSTGYVHFVLDVFGYFK